MFTLVDLLLWTSVGALNGIEYHHSLSNKLAINFLMDAVKKDKLAFLDEVVAPLIPATDRGVQLSALKEAVSELFTREHFYNTDKEVGLSYADMSTEEKRTFLNHHYQQKVDGIKERILQAAPSLEKESLDRVFNDVSLPMRQHLHVLGREPTVINAPVQLASIALGAFGLVSGWRSLTKSGAGFVERCTGAVKLALGAAAGIFCFRKEWQDRLIQELPDGISKALVNPGWRNDRFFDEQQRVDQLPHVRL